jgi:hypothetical protein
MPGGQRPVAPRNRTKERADRDDNALGTIDPVRACSIEDEGAQGLGGIGACILTKILQQPHKNSLIDVERRLRQATVFVHP